MPIKSIEFKNCKSLKDIFLDIDDINLLIGENGTGKTNVIKALDYFYSNLTEDNFNEDFHDKNNPYSQYFEISIEYDLSLIEMESHSIKDNIYINRLMEFKDDNLNDDSFKLILKQYKNEKPEWNYGFKIRQAVKHIYPFYLFRSNNIQVSDWQLLWDIIGDLSRLSVESKGDIRNYIKKEVFNTEDQTDKGIISKENKDVVEFLSSIMDNRDIDVRGFNTKEVFINLSQLYLGGKNLKSGDKSFDYYSDGTNLFKYFNVIIDLVYKISEKKLAEPLILVDEPEMSLHNYYVDKLSKKIVRNAVTDKTKSKSLKFIIATHSPRFTKHIIKKDNANLFHFSFKKNYTSYSKLKTKQVKSSYNVITETEANLLFARAIVYLEGDSDLELFLNQNIIDLYPEIDQVEFYHNLSNSKNDVLLIPKQSSYSVPYLFVVDMDEIIEYNYKQNKISIKNKQLNPLGTKNNDNESDKKTLSKKEKYYYGDEREEIKKIHVSIQNLLDNKFSFKKILHADEKYKDFIELKKLIKEYCLLYNIYVNETTIEGILINKNNYEIFREWLLNYDFKKEDDLNYLIDLYPENEEYKVTLYRLIVEGKLNSTLKYKYSNDKIDKLANKYNVNFNEYDQKEILEKINNISNNIEKTEGWITSFLNYYFNNHDNFNDDFPELSELLSKIKNMVIK
ncbi:AAA family ATPase [Halanaerobiaceae bacterium Z-7014]|uniref:AAA family ATPase n=1 Tax=Halonatronomonas betaini TaxID=2778430 RepID=A0A931AR31_9FIRM|nr:retron Eco8 family effector endonuclease [Halonatronomonas betaini]MBF8436534.1 AAA family ATPase [Halonatronomonas betaini]